VSGPTLPFLEVYVRPFIYGDDPNQPLVTLQRDSANRWWHAVGGEVVREATLHEEWLPFMPSVWQRLGVPAVQA